MVKYLVGFHDMQHSLVLCICEVELKQLVNGLIRAENIALVMKARHSTVLFMIDPTFLPYSFLV